MYMNAFKYTLCIHVYFMYMYALKYTKCVYVGGLLCGIQQGLERLGWNHTKIIAVETEGAASFAAAKSAG